MPKTKDVRTLQTDWICLRIQLYLTASVDTSTYKEGTSTVYINVTSQNHFLSYFTHFVFALKCVSAYINMFLYK